MENETKENHQDEKEEYLEEQDTNKENKTHMEYNDSQLVQTPGEELEAETQQKQ